MHRRDVYRSMLGCVCDIFNLGVPHRMCTDCCADCCVEVWRLFAYVADNLPKYWRMVALLWRCPNLCIVKASGGPPKKPHETMALPAFIQGSHAFWKTWKIMAVLECPRKVLEKHNFSDCPGTVEF